jgi:mono/diheme cytochrome c family protein
MRSRFLLFALPLATGILAACGADDGPAAPTSGGEQVVAGFELAAKGGCFGCHQAGSKGGKSGPTFDGLAGSQVQLSNGTTVTADDAYLRRAIEDPDADISQGYPKGVMSSVMKAKDPYSTEQLDQLIAYLKTL